MKITNQGILTRDNGEVTICPVTPPILVPVQNTGLAISPNQQSLAPMQMPCQKRCRAFRIDGDFVCCDAMKIESPLKQDATTKDTESEKMKENLEKECVKTTLKIAKR